MRRIYYLFISMIASSQIGFSQDSVNDNSLQHQLARSAGKTNLSKYLNSSKWEYLFPHRNGKGYKDSSKPYVDFYSFQSFVKAAQLFPHFLADADATTQKRELAAFLANIAQETSGGWKEAPGGYFKWGLYFLDEKFSGQPALYNDTTKKNYPGIAGAYYFGRGPKQLSWNYNYGQFSEAWYGNREVLLNHPENLSSDPVLSFASAIWFWMTTQYPKPSCHDIIIGNWIPTSIDSLNGRLPGFGATVNVINGGIECAGTSSEKTNYRYLYFEYFCQYLQVDPGSNINCEQQKPFGKN